MNEMVAFTRIKCCILVMCSLIWDHKGKKKNNNIKKCSVTTHTFTQNRYLPLKLSIKKKFKLCCHSDTEHFSLVVNAL